MSYVNDPAYWSLRQLRSHDATEAIASAWEQWFGTRPVTVTAQSIWTSYRPFRKALAVLRIVVTPTKAAPQHMDILFAAFPSEAEFKQALATLPSIDSPPNVLPAFVIRSWRTIAWVLPYVPKPVVLPQLMQPKTIASQLPMNDATKVENLELVRYVPMRRALLRFSVNKQHYYVKAFERSEIFQKSTKALEFIARLPVRVPRLVASSSEMNTLIMESLTGIPLSEYLLVGSLQPLMETGKALAKLHRLTLVPEKIRSASAELQDIEKQLTDDLALALPRLADRITDLVGKLRDQLKQFGEVEPVAIHGKLFGDQILYDPTAKSPIAMVDWDDLVAGDAHFDLGRLIAHILFDAGITPRSDPTQRIAALLEGYQRAGGFVDPLRLQWHVVAALLLRGKISLLRCLPPNWDSRLASLVGQAEDIFSTGSFVSAIMLTEVSS